MSSTSAAHVLLFGAGYFCLQLVGLQLAIGPNGVAAFWPAAGMAVGVLALSRRSRWPAMLVALWLVNVIGNLGHGNPVAISVAFACANTLEAGSGAWLLARPMPHQGAEATASARWVWGRLLPAVTVAPAAAVLIGGGLIAVLAPQSVLDFAPHWVTWFSGDVLGILAITPLVIHLSRSSLGTALAAWVSSWEALAVITAELGLVLAVFGAHPGSGLAEAPMVVLPGLLWAAVRCGTPVTAVLAAAVTAVAVWETGSGSGPYAAAGRAGADILQLQIFFGVAIYTSLAVATLMSEMRSARNVMRAQAAAMANAVEGISYIALDGTYARVNQAYAGALGMVPTDLIAHSWVPTVHPDDLNDVVAAYELMLQEGAGTAEARGVRADGSTFYKEVTMVADRDEAGELLGHHCFMRDVTRRRRSAREAEQFFDMTKHLMLVVDQEGFIYRVNPAWTRLLGYEPSELVGRLPREFFHPDDREMLVQLRQLLVANQSSLTGLEARLLDKAGHYHLLRWDGAFDEDGMFHAAAVDITEAREAERAIAEARDKALETSELKSSFLATMSHEIRTPMNGVIGLSELLETTELDDQQRQFVDGIRTAGSTLLSLINDVLDFSKIEAGKLVLEHADFAPVTLVEEIRSLFQQTALSKGVELNFDIDPALPAALRGDAGRLRQVLVNLVGNAIKFTERGSVSLRLLATPDPSGAAGGDRIGLLCEVADTGIGMEQADLERVFDSFAQANSSTTRTFGGTGLGLAISKQIVEAMDGSITVTSSPGAGSTFGVSLVLDIGVVPTDAQELDRSLLRVLLVDDDETNRAVLAGQLRSWKMNPEQAATPEQGLDLLVEADRIGRPYDIVILDMHMPTMTGLELGARIKQLPGVGEVPMMLMTCGQPVDPDLALSHGIRSTLTKPVLRETLYDALSGLIGGRMTAVPATPAAAAPAGRVLLVEDNKINQRVAVGMLGQLGYTVDVANDGVEATEMAPTGNYQIILMDCQMPRMDGYTATGELRKRPDTARVPIIAMTANAFAEDRERCLAAGMDDYLAKPISRDSLGEALGRWRRDTSEPTAAGGGRSATAVLAPPAPPTAPVLALPRQSSPPRTLPAPAPAPPRPNALIRARIVELVDGSSDEEREIIRSIVESFAGMVPDMVATIEEAAGSGNPDAIGFAAHALRGAAANLGAEGLAEACARLEEDEAPPGAVPDLEAIRQAADDAMQQMRTCLRELLS